MKTVKIEIFKGKGGLWYRRFRAANGEGTVLSHGYKRRWEAHRQARHFVASIIKAVYGDGRTIRAIAAAYRPQIEKMIVEV